MTYHRPPEPDDTPRDALLEAAFEDWVQQAQAPAAFAMRVQARVAQLHAEGQPRPWRQRVGASLVGASRQRDVSEDNDAASQWMSLRLGRGWAVVLAACLVLSLLGNIWLAVQQAGRDTVAVPSKEIFSGPHQGDDEMYARIRLAFRDDVREHDLRTLLLGLRATILAGPSAQGVYQVQVPLEKLMPRVRHAGDKRAYRKISDKQSSEPSLHLLLEALRAHPAVRLAEPSVTP